MNLKDLMSWTQAMQNKDLLREKVRRDAAGRPKEGDIITALSLLKEIKKRIELVEDHQKKAVRYTKDITEYLATLETRGLYFMKEPPTAEALAEPEPKRKTK